jgi:hypothetical protein
MKVPEQCGEAVLEECIRDWSSSGTHSNQHTRSDRHIILAAFLFIRLITLSLKFSSEPFAMSLHYLFGAAALFSAALAHPSTSKHHSHPARLLSSRDVCSGNTASTRSEWCDYSIDTDYATGKR